MTASTVPLALAFTLAAGLAAAHSDNRSTSPADGAVLDAAPQRIAMSFDEPMRLTMVELTDASGTAYDVGREDGMAPLTEFEATTATLGPGSYTVTWRGLSGDGHAMDGSFSFEIAD